MKDRKLERILRFVGEELSRLRAKKGFKTIKDFALRYKLPVIQYWRIERGKANLTVKSLNRILAIHKISFEDFFCNLKV